MHNVGNNLPSSGISRANPNIPTDSPMWDETYMVTETPTVLQSFIEAALAQMPKARDYYDRQIQQRLNTKGKPLYDLQRGKVAKPGVATLRAIADALGQPFELVVQASEGTPTRPVDRIGFKPAPVPGATSDLPVARSIHADDETVEVTQIDLSFSMGNGTHIDDYVEETPVRFDPSYIRSFTRSEISRLRIAKGVGDSMLPTLMSSDLVWIDTTQNRLNQTDRIWACSIHGAAAIKRLRRVGAGQVEVISDNPAVENRVYDEEDIIIHGRVIRFTRDL